MNIKFTPDTTRNFTVVIERSDLEGLARDEFTIEVPVIGWVVLAGIEAVLPVVIGRQQRPVSLVEMGLELNVDPNTWWLRVVTTTQWMSVAEKWQKNRT